LCTSLALLWTTFFVSAGRSQFIVLHSALPSDCHLKYKSSPHSPRAWQPHGLTAPWPGSPMAWQPHGLAAPLYYLLMVVTSDGWLLKAVTNDAVTVDCKLLVWRYLSLDVHSPLRCRCCQQNCRACLVDQLKHRSFPTNYPIGKASKANVGLDT